MKRFRSTGLILLLLLVPLGARAQQPPVPTPTPAPAPEPAPAISCGDCHQDQMASFATNPHAHGKAVKGVVPNAVCESCHGPGQAHIEAGGAKTKIFKPV